MKKRISYFVFCVIFLSSVANFMFIILPRILYPPSEHITFNQVGCEEENKSTTKQNFENIVKDEFSHIKDDHKHDVEVNKKYCGGEECKFLFAYFSYTTESNSSVDYMNYINLAESLGRIMVLSNVGPKSKISACQRIPFKYHYDVKNLKEKFPDVKFISQDKFQKWTFQRKIKPSTSHYYLTDGVLKNSISNIAPYSSTLKKVWCLDKFKLKLDDKSTSFKQIRILSESEESESESELELNENNVDDVDETRNFILNNLQDNSEVLLTRHDTRKSLLGNEPLPELSYAKYIKDASTKIINSLRPYIAIHWDIEHTKTSILPTCASNLLSKVQRTIDKFEIENLYFVSDYPLRHLNEIIASNSTEPFTQSYQSFSYSHTKTIELISSALPYYTVDSLGVIKQLERDLKVKFEDSGIRDILDELVCVNADKYIGLPRWPCNDLSDSVRAKRIVKLRNDTETPVIKF